VAHFGIPSQVETIVIQQDEVDEDDERVKGKVITKVSMDGMATRNLCIDAEALGFRLSSFASLIQIIEDLGVDCVGFHPHIPKCAEIVVSALILSKVCLVGIVD
jgi:Ni2+-binding GTPase involved in maturation of urease and hydrogenase